MASGSLKSDYLMFLVIFSLVSFRSGVATKVAAASPSGSEGKDEEDMVGRIAGVCRE